MRRSDAVNTSLAIFVHGFRGNYLRTWGALSEFLDQHADADPDLRGWDYVFLGYDTGDVKTYLDISALICGAWRRAAAGEAVQLDQPMEFDIVDAHRLLANLGIQGQRLSRQFQKCLDQLRDIQVDRAERERHDLRDAAALFELHKHKGIPWEPADHGFVFSKDQVERFAQRTMRLNAARHIEYVRFHIRPTLGLAS